MTLEAGTPIGKYVVKSKLAEGGMAEIYLATARGPEGFEKEVVIKRVRSFLSDDEGFVRMFIQEARLASRLNHANVVQIFDFDKHEDTYYLAMEYVRGCSLWNLRKRCREKGIRVPPVLVAYIGSQVAAGLHYAHRARSPEGESLGLVHRDVTPHNVLLSFDGAVKLTDFGIAKAGNKLTQPGVLKGKFAYMAPEQARADAVDARTDVFALGVVLWEMLTGGRLFDGDVEVAVLRAVQESVIVPPIRLNPDVPESINEVVTTALQRDPAARYQSAGELERALAQCVLRCATSVDDTDVGTFVRRLFDVPLTQFMLSPAVLQEHSQRHRSGSLPVTSETPVPGHSAPPSTPGAAPVPPEVAPPAPRESTAVMPGREPPSGAQRLAPVTDAEPSLVSASTLVLPRDRPGAGEGKGATVAARPVPTPAVALPAVRESGTQSLAGAPPAPVAASPAPGVGEPESPASRGSSPTPRVSRAGRVGAAVGLAILVGGVAVWRLSPPSEAPPPSIREVRTPAPSAPEAPATSPPVETATPPPPAPAPAETPRVEPAVAAMGTLSVQAFPYAAVYLDGKLLKREVQGTWSTSLAPGAYQLRFVHPSFSSTYTVTITSNARTTQSFRVPQLKRPSP